MVVSYFVLINFAACGGDLTISAIFVCMGLKHLLPVSHVFINITKHITHS